MTEYEQTKRDASRWRIVLENIGRYAGWWQVQIRPVEHPNMTGDEMPAAFTEDVDTFLAPTPAESAPTVRVVVCAANKYGEVLILGARHGDHLMVAQLLRHHESGLIHRGTTCPRSNQGFVDQDGVFMNREEAYEVAKAAGQINRWRPKYAGDWLCSEDLY